MNFTFCKNNLKFKIVINDSIFVFLCNCLINISKILILKIMYD